jgi:D-beta-D-heptose 7-phosphate kinase / D-beta-D-heptose 1-phosphate adenosyltransferase
VTGIEPAGRIGANRPEATDADTVGVGDSRPVRLVVVGDVLLDRDIVGNAERVASEGAALVVGSLRYDVGPGGAGLAACLAAADGHRVTLLNSDASVTRLKGDTRPLVGVDDRAEVLAALSCVDAVAVFDEQTQAQILGCLRPHIYVKGGDYALSDISERDVVESAGGVVVLVPVLEGQSSTSLIESARRGGPLESDSA